MSLADRHAAAIRRNLAIPGGEAAAEQIFGEFVHVHGGDPGELVQALNASRADLRVLRLPEERHHHVRPADRFAGPEDREPMPEVHMTCDLCGAPSRALPGQNGQYCSGDCVHAAECRGDGTCCSDGTEEAS